MSRKTIFMCFVVIACIISVTWVQRTLAMEPDEARLRLWQGNQRFLTLGTLEPCVCPSITCDCENEPECKCSDNSWRESQECNIKTPEGMQNIACGQQPFATIISCSDSRIVPEIIFDAGAEDLFIIRVAGNTLDNIVLGSIEYGIAHAHTPALVVLGHQHCGAVTATVKALSGELKVCKEPKFIRRIIREISHPVRKARRELTTTDPAYTSGQLIDASIKKNVEFVIEELLKKSKTIRDLTKGNHHLKIYGAIAYLDGDPDAGIAPGEVVWLDGYPGE